MEDLSSILDSLSFNVVKLQSFGLSKRRKFLINSASKTLEAERIGEKGKDEWKASQLLEIRRSTSDDTALDLLTKDSSKPNTYKFRSLIEREAFCCAVQIISPTTLFSCDAENYAHFPRQISFAVELPSMMLGAADMNITIDFHSRSIEFAQAGSAQSVYRISQVALTSGCGRRLDFIIRLKGGKHKRASVLFKSLKFRERFIAIFNSAIHSLDVLNYPTTVIGETIVVHASTWNVGDKKPPADLEPLLQAGSADIYVIGLQECANKQKWLKSIQKCLNSEDGLTVLRERALSAQLVRLNDAQSLSSSSGGGSLIIVSPYHLSKASRLASAASYTFKTTTTSTSHGLSDILRDLESACAVDDDDEDGVEDYRLLNVTSLWDIHIVIFVRSSLLPRITGVNYNSQATGYANLLGNKGATGVGLTIDSTTSMAFVTSHLAARVTRINQRQDNMEDISTGLKLDGLTKFPPAHVDFVNQFDYVFWIGDFNYRVDFGKHGSEDEFNFCMRCLKQERYQDLADRDQFKTQSGNGCVMAEFNESPIHFCPTYRWTKGGTEFSNKRNQNPSYCDRVLFKRPRAADDITLKKYDAVFRLNQSDHRPVFGKFGVRLMPPSVLTSVPSALTVYDSCFIIFRKVELALMPDLSPAKCKTIRYNGFDGPMSFVIHSSFLTNENGCGCGGGEVVAGISPGSGIGATNGGAAAGFAEGSGGGSGGIDACGRPVPCWNPNACKIFMKSCKAVKSLASGSRGKKAADSRPATDDDAAEMDEDEENSKEEDDEEKSNSSIENFKSPTAGGVGNKSSSSDSDGPGDALLEPPVWKWPARQIEFVHPIQVDEEMLTKQRLVLVFKKTTVDGPLFGVAEVPLTHAAQAFRPVSRRLDSGAGDFMQTSASDKLFAGLSHAPAIRSDIYDNDVDDSVAQSEISARIDLERRLTSGYAFETKLVLHGKHIGVVRGEIGIVQQSSDPRLGNMRKLSLADSLVRLERAITTSQKTAAAAQSATPQSQSADNFVMTTNAMISKAKEKEPITGSSTSLSLAAVPVSGISSMDVAVVPPALDDGYSGDNECFPPPQMAVVLKADDGLHPMESILEEKQSDVVLEPRLSSIAPMVDDDHTGTTPPPSLDLDPVIATDPVKIEDRQPVVAIVEDKHVKTRTREDDAQDIISLARINGPLPNAITPSLRKRISKIKSVRSLVLALRVNKTLAAETKAWSQEDASDNSKTRRQSTKVKNLLADLDVARSSASKTGNERDYDDEADEQSEGESDDEEVGEKVKRLKKKKETAVMDDLMINEIVQNSQFQCERDMIREVWLEGDTVKTVYGTEYAKVEFKCTHSGLCLFDEEFVFWNREPFLKTVYLKRCEKGYCCGCMEKIQATELALAAGGFRFHSECFRCHHSGRILPLYEPYYEKNGNFYCREAFIELFHTCARCLEGVPLREEESRFPEGERGIRALDRLFHRDCFSCNYCTKKITGDSFYSKDQQNGQGLQPYCEKCYARNFLSACSGCGDGVLPTDETAIVACGGNWHRDHFRCAASGVLLTDEYFEHNGLPYCPDKFYELHANRCNRCNAPLHLDESVISVGNNLHYHTACFRCVADDAPLPFDGKNYEFFEHDLQVYCPTHYIDNICPSCLVCGEKVVGERVSFLQHFIHPDCMNCQSCRMSLLRTSAFAGSNGLPYCHKCYTEFFSVSCAACGFVIAADQNPVRAISDKLWHPDHFVCTSCRRNLVGIEYFEKSLMPFCKQCFLPRFGVRCGSCLQRIMSGEQLIHVQAATNYYHVGCYQCFCCEKHFQGAESIFVKSDKIFCQECYSDVCIEMVCNYCQQSISSGPKVVLRGGTLVFHKQCTICFECKKSVGPASVPPNSVTMFVRTETGSDDFSLLSCEEHMSTRHSKLSIEGQERVTGQFASTLQLYQRRKNKKTTMVRRAIEYAERERARDMEIEDFVAQSKKSFEEIVQSFSGDMRMSAMNIIHARKRRSTVNSTDKPVPLPLESLLLKQFQAMEEQNKAFSDEIKRNKEEAAVRAEAEMKATRDLEVQRLFVEAEKVRVEQDRVRKLEEDAVAKQAIEEARLEQERIRKQEEDAKLHVEVPPVSLPVVAFDTSHTSDDKSSDHRDLGRTSSGKAKVRFSDSVSVEGQDSVVPVAKPVASIAGVLHSPSPPPELPMSPLPKIDIGSGSSTMSAEKQLDGPRSNSVSFKSDIVLISEAELATSTSPQSARSSVVDSDTSLGGALKKTGYLNKKASDSSMFHKGQWQRRFFVLESGALTYYKSEDEYLASSRGGRGGTPVPKGRNVVEGPVGGGDSFEFSVMPEALRKTDSLQQQLSLKADTEIERRDWMRALAIWLS